MVVKKKKKILFSHTHRYSIKNRPYCLGKSLRFEISIWETLPTVPGIPLSLLPLPNFPFPFRKPLPHFWMRETTPWGTNPPPFCFAGLLRKKKIIGLSFLTSYWKDFNLALFWGKGGWDRNFVFSYDKFWINYYMFRRFPDR